jgi:hypothetical protein
MFLVLSSKLRSEASFFLSHHVSGNPKFLIYFASNNLVKILSKYLAICATPQQSAGCHLVLLMFHVLYEFIANFTQKIMR